MVLCICSISSGMSSGVISHSPFPHTHAYLTGTHTLTDSCATSASPKATWPWSTRATALWPCGTGCWREEPGGMVTSRMVT